jgi:4'-phosphopantetheinyl transferase
MIPEGAVHVWSAVLEAEADGYEQLVSVLSGEERRRAARYHAELDRRRWTIARAFVRDVLGHYTGVAPRALAFEHGARGKPSLATGIGDGSLRFNLSHADGMALCAVTRAQDVGVDIERIREDLPVARIAAQFFSAREQRLVAEAENPAAAFTRIWVRKEAYLKATGLGVGTGLTDFDVSLVGGSEIIGPSAQASGSWTIQELPARSAYVSAVATRGPADPVLFRYAKWGRPGQG